MRELMKSDTCSPREEQISLLQDRRAFKRGLFDLPEFMFTALTQGVLACVYDLCVRQWVSPI